MQLKSTNQSFTFPNLKTNVPLYRQDKSTTIGPVNGKKQKQKTITCILKTAQITAQGKKIIHIYNHIIDHIPMKKLRNQKQNKQTGPMVVNKPGTTAGVAHKGSKITLGC